MPSASQIRFRLQSIRSDTGKIADEKISQIIRDHFQLTPRGIIESLNLRRPIYRKTANYGHFGRTNRNSRGK